MRVRSLAPADENRYPGNRTACAEPVSLPGLSRSHERRGRGWRLGGISRPGECSPSRSGLRLSALFPIDESNGQVRPARQWVILTCPCGWTTRQSSFRAAQAFAKRHEQRTDGEHAVTVKARDDLPKE